MRKNTDPKNSKYGHFSHSVYDVVKLSINASTLKKQHEKEVVPDNSAQKMKFSNKDFLKLRRKKLQIWSHLLKKSLLENFVFVQCKFEFWMFQSCNFRRWRRTYASTHRAFLWNTYTLKKFCKIFSKGTAMEILFRNIAG